MELSLIKDKLPEEVYMVLQEKGITALRPSQEKAVAAGLFNKNNLLVCTPTASGKTLIAELAALGCILHEDKMALYIVPLKSLAAEKYAQFKRDYGHLIDVALSIGNSDSADTSLGNYDLVVSVSEKIDSLIRHKANWLSSVGAVIIDEIHLLNDVTRGPTLEILITLLRQMLTDVHIIGLSATIGNPGVLASWLDARLVVDDWRPVPLKMGVLCSDELEFITEDRGSP